MIEQILQELEAGIAAIEAATSTYAQMKAKHGSDWTKWPPTSKWFVGLTHFANAKALIDKLPEPPALTAEFTEVSP